MFADVQIANTYLMRTSTDGNIADDFSRIVAITASQLFLAPLASDSR
jgi:hypothetical protein